MNLSYLSNAIKKFLTGTLKASGWSVLDLSLISECFMKKLLNAETLSIIMTLLYIFYYIQGIYKVIISYHKI